MLLYDALVGNSDRHMYNWGVIRDVKDKVAPYFAPIYDSARGLLWNSNEKKIVKLHKALESNNTQEIDAYINRCKPLMSWDDMSGLNQFQFVELIVSNSPGVRSLYRNKIRGISLVSCVGAIEQEFGPLISKERLTLTKYCIEKRFERIKELLF